jgi:hypothetical protein
MEIEQPTIEQTCEQTTTPTTPKRSQISKTQIEQLYELYLSDYIQAELMKLSNLKQSSKAKIVSDLFEEQHHITVSIPTIISLFKSDISLYEAGNKKYYIKTPRQKIINTKNKEESIKE